MLRELKSSTAERCYTMMDNLRTAANSVVLKIIFGIIIVSFILTGVSGYLIGGSNNYAAKVNDQEIGRSQFENASERNRMQQQLGDQFSNWRPTKTT
jgi:peptidyl-prolyl cis-trans isomerase D